MTADSNKTPLTGRQARYVEQNWRKQSPGQMAREIGAETKGVRQHVRELKLRARRRREFVFRGIALLIPVVVIVLAETVLRLIGYGGNLDLFVSSYSNGDYMMINRAVGRRYFHVQQVTPAVSYDAFLKQKPENGFRVFVLGGSSAAGYPYLYNGAFSRMLADRLRDALPDHTVEVVNVAMPAVNSFTLLDQTDDVLDQSPDALLIYSGHNEFYGALGVGSTEFLGQMRGIVLLSLRLGRFKVFRVLQDFIGWARGLLGSSGEDGAASRTLMEHMAREKEIAHDSPKYERALDSFRKNIKDIVAAAGSRGVPVYLGTLVSNVRDQPPFVSVFDEKTNREAWEKRFAQGLKAQRAERVREALEVYNELKGEDAKPAKLHFRTAQCLERLGHPDSARAVYYRATDLDGLRFRASEDFNRVLREIAAETGSPLVPVQGAFEAASPDHLIGKDLMLEHLHPNAYGYFLMAKAFGEALCATLSGEYDCQASRIQPDSVYWAESGVTPLDEDIAGMRVKVLTSGWPFRPASRYTPLDRMTPKSFREKTALAFLRDEISWERAHVKMAEHYASRGHLDSAAVEYGALVKGTPQNVSPYIRLAETYLALGQFDDAEGILWRSLRVESTTYANKWLGSLLLQRGKTEEGVGYLEKACRADSTDLQTRYNLSGALALVGRRAEAKHHLKYVLDLAPGHRGAQDLWRQLK